MDNRKNLKKRMYFLTMYNLSDIQKSIQCGHAALEYALIHKDDESMWDFIKNHKTWIILNGGTSNDGTQSFYGLEKALGSMEQNLAILEEKGIKLATFREPDLNYALSSICFIVDERIFNREDYPEFSEYIIKTKENVSFNFSLPLEEQYPDEYKKWVELIGGEKNVFLKTFLSPRNFKMA